jgi:hypothetical protein
MPTLTYPVPVQGQPSNTEDAKTLTALNTIITWATGIDGANLVASVTGRRQIMRVPLV